MPPIDKNNLPEVGEEILMTLSSGSGVDTLSGEVVEIGRNAIELTNVEFVGESVTLDASTTWNGEAVQVSYMRDSGLFQFSSMLRQIRGKDGNEVYGLDLPHHISRTQRRNDYRLPLNLNSTLRQNGVRSGSAHGHVPVQIVNLSVGGALILSTTELRSDDYVVLNVPTGTEGAFEPIDALVLETESYELRSGTVYTVHLQFDNGANLRLRDAIREELSRYIFTQQRILLRVRKLMIGSSETAGKKRARTAAELLAEMRVPSSN